MSERPDDDILSLAERRGLSLQGMDRLHRHITTLESRLAVYETTATSTTVEGIMALTHEAEILFSDDDIHGTQRPWIAKKTEIRTAVTALVADRDAQADRAKRAEAVVEAARNLFRHPQGDPFSGESYSLKLKKALDAYDAGGTDGQ